MLFFGTGFYIWIEKYTGFKLGVEFSEREQPLTLSEERNVTAGSSSFAAASAVPREHCAESLGLKALREEAWQKVQAILFHVFLSKGNVLKYANIQP